MSGRARGRARALTIVIALVILALGAAPHAATLPSAEQLKQLGRSIVKVQARGCPGGDRAASGFIWNQPTTVVTALHVVAGCQEISLYYESERVTRAATTIRVHRRNDLALLQVQNAPSLPVLQPSTTAPQLHDEVIAVGYPLNVSAAGSAVLRLRYGAKRLKDIVPPAVRAELQNIGSPDLEIEIVNLDGHLLPGLSGAPILDGAGRVVAVGDGGLENGAASISWALSVASLPALMTSTDAVPSGTARMASLFAAGVQSTAGKAVRCGALEVTKLRTRRYADIARSADDALGLSQLAAGLAVDLSEFEFDIYQHLQSGGTLVVPSGSALESAGALCVARSRTSPMELKAQLTSVATGVDVQARSVDYENALIAGSLSMQWQLDPSWTYLAPQQRFDGLIVRRKAAYKVIQNQAGRFPEKYVFATLASRGTVFIGSSVTDHNYSPAAIRLGQMCLGNPAAPGCAQWTATRREWARFVIGVHLTTFPIG